MTKPVGLIMVDVPEAVLGMTRFVMDHCGIAVEPLPARRLRDKGGLDRFGAVLFPGGGSELYRRDLGDDGIANLKRFIQKGGGYVGICAGCIFAFETGLLTGSMFRMPGMGVHILQHRAAHDIFRGYPGRSGPFMLRVHGPLMEVAKPTRALAYYDQDKRYAAVAVRTLGKGRVVGFSVHPEGGLAWGGGNYNPYFYFDGKVHKTCRMLRNALNWVRRAPVK
ncbi:MAG TPA: BPL-N domain-containing protein [Candidatus Brocadiia bacterium]|mgnify:CR=1 FL=1|nr:BPL-N domain-containing protein [Candidatus Brocadiia bacterium]